MRIADDFVTVEGGQVFVRQLLPDRVENDVPIILLHDSLGCVRMWRDFPEWLGERLNRPIILYDRLGFGQSSPRDALPSARFVDEEALIYFPKILSALNIKQFSLLGHSVGGCMALAIASKLDGCQAVMTLAAQKSADSHTKAGILVAKEQFKDQSLVARLAKYHGDKVAWVLSAWMDVWLSDAFSEWSIADYLPTIQAPVLSVVGDQDEYVFPDVPEYIARGVENGRFCILNKCGHMIHRENPQTTIALADYFF